MHSRTEARWFSYRWYSEPGAAGANVANLTEAVNRGSRGGCYRKGSDLLRAARRGLPGRGAAERR
jgi:hypothetical protein